MQEKSKQLLVIGGGPAGMAAAIFASRAGIKVTLLEKNEKLGKKLYITGKGRCNVSNAAQGEEFLRNIPRNPRFLYAAMDHLSSADLRQLLLSLGCETLVERGQRIFPLAQKASDVTRALTRGLEQVDVRLDTEVKEISLSGGDGFNILLTNGDALQARALIVATGGLSYSVTGSTGDGYRFARALGHSVSDCCPSLVPVETSDSWVRALQGLTLKNVSLLAKRGRKTLFEEQGEMLFTHFGISGPLVLSLSSILAGMDLTEIDLSIDMKPALTREQLDERLKRVLLQGGAKQLKSVLPDLLPGKMADQFPAICQLDAAKQCSQLTAHERSLLVQTLKHIPLHATGTRPFSEAVVTRGGISTSDLNPSSMASRMVPGLFFAGEIIDVDGFTGGFNLQIAFSTGALAGRSAAAFISES